MKTIRPARKEDAKDYLNYLKQIGQESDNLSFGKEGLPFSIEQEEMYIESIEKPSLCLLVMENNRIIANATIDVLPRRMQHRANISLSVIKEKWNQGIGSYLLEYIIEHAKENNIEILNLEVRSDNACAIHLYEKFGFHKIGAIPAYLKIENEYIDFYSMYLFVKK